MTHYSDLMVEMNRSHIRIDSSELCRNWRLMRETALPGMKELYRGYIRNNIRSIRISRDNMARWGAL